MKMTNNTILITGGTSGIGYELARQLCTTNTVIITGRNQEKLEKVKAELKNVEIYKSNVSDPQDIVKLYDYISKTFPNLNMLMNNAGVSKKVDLQTDADLLDLTFEVETNLNGLMRMCVQFLPLLKQQKEAAIVNTSSILSMVPIAKSPVYCATKAAVHSFTQSLRIQLKGTNIKVFELAPPATVTPILDAFSEEERKSLNAMDVTKMVNKTIDGMLQDKFEIRPGLSSVVKNLNKISSSIALNMLNR